MILPDTDCDVGPEDPQGGARYFPASDTWRPVTTANAPAGRSGLTTVWTGSRMLVWGGRYGAFFNRAGGSYDPATDQWTPIKDRLIPSARYDHTAIWTGSRMIIWGGNGGPAFSDQGDSYDPVTDQWTTLPSAAFLWPRWKHTAVWTGTEMLVWGGQSVGGAPTPWVVLGDGGRYNSSTQTWTPIAAAGAPSPRYSQTAVWTGTEMLIWGGLSPSGDTLGDGAAYKP